MKVDPKKFVTSLVMRQGMEDAERIINNYCNSSLAGNDTHNVKFYSECLLEIKKLKGEENAN